MKHRKVAGALVLLGASLSKAFNVNVGGSRSFQISKPVAGTRFFWCTAYQGNCVDACKGESCSAMCSVSSLLFNCDFECGSVSSECSGPEDSIEEQIQIIAEAEEEIDAENEKRNDAESFSKMMDFIDQKLEEPDVRKTPNDIKKCEDFESRYIEFLDLMVDL